MKKKILIALLLTIALTCVFAVAVSADEVAASPYESYYDDVYTALDGTPLALYEKDGDTNYPLAWFYNSETGVYEEFRVGTEVIFAVNGGSTQIPSGTDFRENASVIFTDETKTYTMANLILVNLQGTKTNMFSGSWSNLPIQAIYCNNYFAYVNGSTFTGNTSLCVFDIPKTHVSTSATICAAFQKCTNLKEIYIAKGVCVLSSAFENSGLERVEFAPDYQPKGLFDWQTTTGKGYWFKGCTSLTTVVLPTTSTQNYIGSNTFEGCTSLTSINIPDCFVAINSNAFKKCTALTQVSIPAGFTTIGDYAFQDCQALSSLTFRGNAGTDAIIGIGAFERCYIIGTVSIPEGVKTLDNCAFKHAGVTHLSLPTTLTTINGGSTFMLSGATDKITTEYRLQSVTGLEKTQITTIVDSMFRGQSKWTPEIIILPNTVQTISNDYAFADVGMSGIRLSASLTHLGHEAFTGCAKLKNVYVPGTIQTYGSNPFNSKGTHFFVTSNDTTYLASFAAKAGTTNYVSIEDYNKNPDNYKSGKWIIYGLNSCETFYGAHAIDGAVGVDKFIGETYVSEYAHVVACARNCGKDSVTVLCGPLFVNKGYSTNTIDGVGITYTIVFNPTAIKEYEELAKTTFEYGLIAATTNVVKNGVLFDQTGKAVDENSIVTGFAGTDYTIYNLKITSIPADAQGTGIYACAYIIDTNSAGVKTINYVGDAVATVAEAVTYQAISQKESTMS